MNDPLIYSNLEYLLVYGALSLTAVVLILVWILGSKKGEKW